MLFTLVLAAAAVSLKPLEAIIIDANYMPSAPKQQVHAYTPKKVVLKQREPIVVREKQNEEYHVAEETYPTVKPLYKYGYSVFDPYTLDIKSQWEHRDGDYVRGAYNMLEADGSLRIVEYTSDKDSGFRAIVKKIPFFLEQSRRQVENLPKYTSQNNPTTRPNIVNHNNNYLNNNNNNHNNNYQNHLTLRPIINHNTNNYQDIQPQAETPTPLAPIIYHHEPTANFHPHHHQQQQQQQQQQQHQHQQQQQNEINGQQYNRQTENYVQHGKYFKQHYLSKQKQSSSASTPTPVIPADLYKMLPPL